MKRHQIVPFGFERPEIERLRKKFERLFSVLQEAAEAESLESYGAFHPCVDLRETADSIKIDVELAGVDPEKLSISANSREVIIEGVRNRSKETESGVSHFCCERQYGKFRRAVPLRWAIDLSKTSALLENGLLQIVLPKLADRRGRSVKIPVNVISSDESKKRK